MGRIFGLLLMVCALWVGLEVFNHGVSGAFGGKLAGLQGASESASAYSEDRASTPKRAGAAVKGAHTVADERRNRLLAE